MGLRAVAPGYQAVMIQPALDLVDEFNFSYQTVHGKIEIRKNGQNWHIRMPEEIKIEIDLSVVGGKMYI